MMKHGHKKFQIKRFLVAMFVTMAVILICGKIFAADVQSDTRMNSNVAPTGGKTVARATSAATPGTNMAVATGATATATTQAPDTSKAGAANYSADLNGQPSQNGSTTPSYWKRMDDIRADTDITSAEIDNLKAHHDLDQARQGNFKSNEAAALTQPGMQMLPMPSSAQQPDAVLSAGSRIASIEQTSMVDGRWTASIRVPSGGYINKAQAGQSVPGVGKILSISHDGVTVNDGKKTYSLPFANDDSSQGGMSPGQRSGMSIAPPVGLH